MGFHVSLGEGHMAYIFGLRMRSGFGFNKTQGLGLGF